MRKRFTVVIPTYNRAGLLPGAIESVLEQTHVDFELLVVDDGSSDGTADIVGKYDDQRLKYVYVPHKGVSFARNTGIKLSQGDYIAFLDSDDRWANRKLEITDKYIGLHPSVNIFHTEEIWYRRGRLLAQKKKHRKYSGFIYKKCLPICCIGMSTAVVSKSLFEEAGMFDTNLPACEDYDLWLRFCSRYEVKLIPFALTIKNGGREDQLSVRPGLDKYRVHALEKLIKSDVLSPLQREMAMSELVKRSGIYAQGAEKRGKHKEAEKFYYIRNQYANRSV